MVNKNKVINVQTNIGDCLTLLDSIQDKSIDLIYLDPPFFTQRVHKLSGRNRQEEYIFNDTWEDLPEYEEFLYTRLVKMQQKLKVSGSIFFHCDKNASHRIRGLLNIVFSEKNFRSEIIWHYKKWSNSAKNLIQSHQTIFFYSKTKSYKFNRIYTDYSPTTNVDQLLQKRERDSSNKSVYAETANGNIVVNGEKKGVPLGDVWDMPYLNPKAKERVGYPTQKPIHLLKRVISLVTDEGDTVLDPFCGSGTTLVAAHLLNRRSIGFDTSEEAITIANQRLSNPIESESGVLKKGREAYKQQKVEILALLPNVDLVPVQRNKSIDAILKEGINSRPVLFRVQRDGETIDNLIQIADNTRQKKQAIAAIIILTASYSGSKKHDLPDGVYLVNSTTSQVNQVLEYVTIHARAK